MIFYESIKVTNEIIITAKKFGFSTCDLFDTFNRLVLKKFKHQGDQYVYNILGWAYHARTDMPYTPS